MIGLKFNLLVTNQRALEEMIREQVSQLKNLNCLKVIYFFISLDVILAFSPHF